MLVILNNFNRIYYFPYVYHYYKTLIFKPISLDRLNLFISFCKFPIPLFLIFRQSLGEKYNYAHLRT